MSQIDLLPRSSALGCSARFSADRLYRYSLHRCRGWGKGVVNFVMLNPSTADEDRNDPTVERCERFAQRWGYGVLTVTNVYAYRATDPRELRIAVARGIDVVGPENDAELVAQASAAELVVVAWGNHAGIRARKVHELLVAARDGRVPLCLGVNKTGQPVHPLYQAADAKLEPYPGMP